MDSNGKALIGDTGYDSNDFVQAVRDRGVKPVIHRSLSARRSTDETEHSISNAISSRSSSNGSSGFAPSRLATRRPRATISLSFSAVRDCGLAEAKLGARAAGDFSEAA